MMEQLSCSVQNYGWGRVGAESIVAKLSGSPIDAQKPYAELWMGTHPNGPSRLKSGDITLLDYIKGNPQAVDETERDGLRFLFKVLSVGKALSVQSHPNKEQAKRLHLTDPKNYPDANHKPEIAIALSDFEVLSGFRVHHEIISNFKAHSELIRLVDENDLGQLAVEHSEAVNKRALKALFSSIWKSPQSAIAAVVEEIVARISKKDDRPDVENLVLRLNAQYPGGDVGVLAPFFLNHFTLKPAESIFIGPNEPHAYLFGDCMECMACSDNTIRAGLTPKFKDVEVLCENLNYNMISPPYFKPVSTGGDDDVTLYAPPVEEFAVQKLNRGVKSIGSVGASSILIVIAGSATVNATFGSAGARIEMTTGSAWFLPTYSRSDTVAVERTSADFLAFRAYTPR